LLITIDGALCIDEKTNQKTNNDYFHDVLAEVNASACSAVEQSAFQRRRVRHWKIKQHRHTLERFQVHRTCFPLHRHIVTSLRNIYQYEREHYINAISAFVRRVIPIKQYPTPLCMGIYTSHEKPLARRRKRGWGESVCKAIDSHLMHTEKYWKQSINSVLMLIHARTLTPTPLPPAGEGLSLTYVDIHIPCVGMWSACKS